MTRDSSERAFLSSEAVSLCEAKDVEVDARSGEKTETLRASRPRAAAASERRQAISRDIDSMILQSSGTGSLASLAIGASAFCALRMLCKCSVRCVIARRVGAWLGDECLVVLNNQRQSSGLVWGGGAE
eukprot:scaffold54512_cov37-Tisochrysis_lutea.AAC.1